MRIGLIILFFLIANPICAQNLPEPIIGTIKIKKIDHTYYKEGKYEDGKTRVTNKQNIPSQIYYFDKTGNLTEVIGYGKIHFNDLSVLDFATYYRYNGNNITGHTQYSTDYQKNIDTIFKTIYYYNERKQLIRADKIDCKENKISDSTEYVYSDRGKEALYYLSPTYYYHTFYDSIGRLLRHQQILDNKLRWEHIYTYRGSIRFSVFKTYSKDIEDHDGYEVLEYKNGQLVQATDYSIGSRMKKYYYNKAGLLTTIEHYSNYTDGGYELRERIHFKTKKERKLNKETIDKINASFLIDYLNP